MPNTHANDAMIRRLEKELEERNSAVQGIISNAQDAERDLNDAEKETLSSLEAGWVSSRSRSRSWSPRPRPRARSPPG